MHNGNPIRNFNTFHRKKPELTYPHKVEENVNIR